MGLTYVPLPEDLELMRSPFGELYEGEGLQVLLSRLSSESKSRVLSSVGDVVTAYLLRSGFFPNLAVTDGRTLRKESGITPIGKDYSVIEISNPAGGISDEALSVIRRLSNFIGPMDRVWIKVDGEEDMLALPVIAYFPSSAITLYGQPNRGIVLVTGNAKKEEALRILERMQVARRS